MSAAPHLLWDVFMENVASMSPEHRTEITKQLESVNVGLPCRFDAAELGQVHRPRLYWTTFPAQIEGFEFKDSGRGYLGMRNISKERMSVKEFLDVMCVVKGDLIVPPSPRLYVGFNGQNHHRI